MKKELVKRHLKIYYLLFIFIFTAQVTLYAENKKYDKYGIINGKNVNLMTSAPSGNSIIEFKTGEVVYVINKSDNNAWYQVKSLNNKIGWIKNENLYYLDQNKIPDNYFIQILKMNIEDSEVFSLYNCKFEYFKDYNLISYKFFQIDPPVGFQSLKIYEVKNSKVSNVTSHHNFYEKVFVNDKYVFVIGDYRITVYDRNKLDTIGKYNKLKGPRIKDNYCLVQDESILDFNKSDNCYYLKVKVRDKKTREIHEETYKFNGEKLIQAQ